MQNKHRCCSIFFLNFKIKLKSTGFPIALSFRKFRSSTLQGHVDASSLGNLTGTPFWDRTWKAGTATKFHKVYSRINLLESPRMTRGQSSSKHKLG